MSMSAGGKVHPSGGILSFTAAPQIEILVLLISSLPSKDDDSETEKSCKKTILTHIAGQGGRRKRKNLNPHLMACFRCFLAIHFQYDSEKIQILLLSFPA